MDVFTAISLCTGYDGIGLGLARAIPNLRTVAYVERECFAVCNLVAKIQAKLLDDAPIWDDVSTFDGRPFTGMVDIIHAGVPCQPWSVAGKRAGTADDLFALAYTSALIMTYEYRQNKRFRSLHSLTVKNPLRDLRYQAAWLTTARRHCIDADIARRG